MKTSRLKIFKQDTRGLSCHLLNLNEYIVKSSSMELSSSLDNSIQQKWCEFCFAGVLDGSDNCPLNANRDQADSESDGTGDICDSDDDDDSTLV